MSHDVTNQDISELERLKYEDMWTSPDYRRRSPGEDCVPLFLELIEKHDKEPRYRNGTLIDWGCGTGRALKGFMRDFGYLKALDIAKNCLDKDLESEEFLETYWCDFSDPSENLVIHPTPDYSFCADVMEHIHPTRVNTALTNIKKYTQRLAFFQIAHFPDKSGHGRNHDLHLTVRPDRWWGVELEGAGFKIIDRCPGIDRSWYLCR